KILIDAHREEWKKKPVTFVSYGGMSGGLRAVEHLRAVFAELYSIGTRNGVVIHAPWDHLVDGTLELDDAAVASALAAMDELIWWAELLKSARVADQGAA
ncbi:MAG: NADPH-dependent oxidoreductase, partial [Gordonia sp. (in: high G+C Gram-positive bacteria)]